MEKINEKNAIKNTPLRRIKYLVLMQIGENIRLIKSADKRKFAFKTFLLCCLAIGITLGLYFLLNFIQSYFSYTLDENMFTSILLVTQIFSIYSCTGNMITVLYASKENSILLACPCKYNEIFISKIIVYTLKELKKSCFFVLPFLISYGLLAGGGAYFGLLIPVWIMLCLIPILISAILSIPMVYLKRFLQSKAVLYAIVIVVAIAGLFTLSVYVLSKVPTPIRIVAIYGKFMNAVQVAFVKINKFALYYNFIGKMMFGNMVYLYLPIMLVILVSLVALCFFVAMPFYFKAVSRASEFSVKTKHKEHSHKFNGIYWTFLRKEFTLFFRTSSSLSSAIMVILLFPLISYVLNFILAAINTTSLGDYMTVAFNVMITLSLLGTHNANCAQAISSEGSEFAVLKASPSNTMVISWAKLTVTSIVNLLGIITTFIMLTATTSLGAIDLILMGILIMLVSMGQIFWSFQLDITNPKINDYVVKGAVVDNPNVAKAITISFVIATLTGVITLLLLVDHYVTGWIRIFAIAIGFFAARVYLYNSNLKVYFNDIQA